MDFLRTREFLLILYHALLSQTFDHLLLNNICFFMAIMMYHNVLITSYL